MKGKRFCLVGVMMILFLGIAFPVQADIGTVFTYQGRLTDNAGTPLTGSYDFEFKLYDALSSGSQVGSTVPKNDVPVSQGHFTLVLDFGLGIFTGSPRWLEIGARPGTSTGAFSTLTPRQPLTPTPYALYAANAPGGTGGGDITGVFPNTGLSGGGSSGDVYLSLAETYRLPQGCTSSQIPKYNGTVWGCGNDDASSGFTVPIEKTCYACSSYVMSLINNTGAGNGLRAQTNSTTAGNAAVSAVNSGTGIGVGASGSPGVYGMSTTGIGVVGETSAPILPAIKGTNTGQGVGVEGTTGSSAFPAIMATNSGTGRALEAYSGAGGAIYGMSSGGGAGMYGSGKPGLYGLSSTGNAIKGEASTAGWAAIFGNHTGNSIGVYGSGAVGVQGSSTTGDAIRGISSAAGFSGVYGQNNAGYGGYFSGSTSGIYAEATSGMAAEFIGRVRTSVLEITGGSDFSENFDIRGYGNVSTPTPGMVVSIDPREPGKLVLSNSAYDRKVAGIISGAGGVKPGMVMGQEGTLAQGSRPVALTGRVYCWADASQGAIEPGDLLTSSDTPGHAIKVTDYPKAQGAIIGKAMTGLQKGQGLILVLVSLQ
jgi:hypothetical protein